MPILRHILRFFAAAALFAQLALPYAQASAATANDFSAFICNPSGRAASAEARAALVSLLSVVDPDFDPKDPLEPLPHCDLCVAPSIALDAPASIFVDRIAYAEPTDRLKPSSGRFATSPRGPPCGTRAPPFFV